MAALQSSTEGHPPKPPSRSFLDILSSPSSSQLHSRPATNYRGFPSLAFSAEEINRYSAPFRHALIGKFSSGRPPMESIRKSFISIGFAGTYSLGLIDYRHILIKFNIEDDYVRAFLKRIYTIDGFSMRLFKWSPDFSVDSESAILPIWINFPLLPLHLFNKEALYNIARLIGEPLKMDASTAALTRPSVARVCVELDLRKVRPEKIWLVNGETGFWQLVEYEKIPPLCSKCLKIGHHADSCRSVDYRPMPTTVGESLKAPLSQKVRQEYRPKLASIPNLKASAENSSKAAEIIVEAAATEAMLCQSSDAALGSAGVSDFVAETNAAKVPTSTSHCFAEAAENSSKAAEVEAAATEAMLCQSSDSAALGSEGVSDFVAETSAAKVPTSTSHCFAEAAENSSIAAEVEAAATEAMLCQSSDSAALGSEGVFDFVAETNAAIAADVLSPHHSPSGINSDLEKQATNVVSKVPTSTPPSPSGAVADDADCRATMVARATGVSVGVFNPLPSDLFALCPTNASATPPSNSCNSNIVSITPFQCNLNLNIDDISQDLIAVCQASSAAAKLMPSKEIVANVFDGHNILGAVVTTTNDAHAYLSINGTQKNSEVPVPSPTGSISKEPFTRAELDDLLKNLSSVPIPRPPPPPTRNKSPLPSTDFISVPKIMDVAPIAVLPPETSQNAESSDFDSEELLCYDEDLEVQSSYFQPLALTRGRGKTKEQIQTDRVLRPRKKH